MGIDLDTLKAVQAEYSSISRRSISLYLSRGISSALSVDEQNVAYAELVKEAKAALKRYVKDGTLVVYRKAEFIPGMGMQATEYRLKKND